MVKEGEEDAGRDTAASNEEEEKVNSSNKPAAAGKEIRCDALPSDTQTDGDQRDLGRRKRSPFVWNNNKNGTKHS
jgi:hypothetical protein